MSGRGASAESRLAKRVRQSDGVNTPQGTISSSPYPNLPTNHLLRGPFSLQFVQGCDHLRRDSVFRPSWCP